MLRLVRVLVSGLGCVPTVGTRPTPHSAHFCAAGFLLRSSSVRCACLECRRPVPRSWLGLNLIHDYTHHDRFPSVWLEMYAELRAIVRFLYFSRCWYWRVARKIGTISGHINIRFSLCPPGKKRVPCDLNLFPGELGCVLVVRSVCCREWGSKTLSLPVVASPRLGRIVVFRLRRKPGCCVVSFVRRRLLSVCLFIVTVLWCAAMASGW